MIGRNRCVVGCSHGPSLACSPASPTPGSSLARLPPGDRDVLAGSRACCRGLANRDLAAVLPSRCCDERAAAGEPPLVLPTRTATAGAAVRQSGSGPAVTASLARMSGLPSQFAPPGCRLCCRRRGSHSRFQRCSPPEACQRIAVVDVAPRSVTLLVMQSCSAHFARLDAHLL
jgi:hypothetical protein